MPLSEGCFVGVATGLSLSGYQPIVELMFGDFIGLAFDQIVNLATKSVTMYGRDVVLPLLIRCPVGGNRAYGPTHSQSLQKHFIGIPNLDLFELTPFHDPAPLLARILDGHRPAILFEDKVLYTATRRVGPTVDDLFALEHVGDFAVLSPVDRPRSVGACLIASGGTSLRCLEAVRELLIEDEVDCEVLVPQKLYPLDLAPVRDRLLRAERIYVVEESTMGGTWGAEVAKAIYDDCWSELHGPVGLIHSRDAIIPSARHLERKVLVQSSDICAAIRRDRARRPSSK
jgi:pyruvate dehydrogenase E1 component beta subunit